METTHKDELISALVDGECRRFELRRSVDQLISDSKSHERWSRYHLIGNVLRQDVKQIAGARFHAEIMSQLAQEQHQGSPSQTFQQRLTRPLIGFAMAASVAAVMVLGLQSLLGPEQVHTGLIQQNVSIESPRQMAELQQAKDPGHHVATQLESYMRMNSYLLSHAEQTSGQGVMPFVRMVSYTNNH